MNPDLIKAPLFLLCLTPLTWLVWAFQTDVTSAEPLEAMTRGLGTWGLNFLVLTLCVTPLRKFSGWAGLGRLRRMLGLFAFFYAVLHATSYLWLDQSFDVTAIAKDIFKRPFITAGLICLILLVPLAATSNAYALRRLGGRRWQELHRSIYLIALLAVLHFGWMVESEMLRPLAYAAAVGLLLGVRAWWRVQERRRQLAGVYLPERPVNRGKTVIPIFVKK